MQPEEKAAIKAAGATALIAGAFAATIATPVAWAAVISHGQACLQPYQTGAAARKLL
jgi:hypothetical protein